MADTGNLNNIESGIKGAPLLQKLVSVIKNWKVLKSNQRKQTFFSTRAQGHVEWHCGRKILGDSIHIGKVDKCFVWVTLIKSLGIR